MILVNLTCGRNPWKRASIEDRTFSAYLRDRSFLQTILPFTTEAVAILSRIFEIDPSQRITIPELRELIEGCLHLTTVFMSKDVGSGEHHSPLADTSEEHPGYPDFDYFDMSSGGQ